MATATPRAALLRIAAAFDGRTRLRVVGAEGGFRGLLLSRLCEGEAAGPVACVARDDRTARQWAADAAFFGAGTDETIAILPEPDTSPYADMSPDPRAVASRLATVARLTMPDARPALVIGSLRAWVRKTMPPDALRSLSQTWAVGDEIERAAAVAALHAAGYQKVEVVEDPGTYAVRGGVMDVYIPILRFPVRIEWFGDEIERLRTFDPESQRSLRDIGHCRVHVVRETIATTDAPIRSRILALADAVNAPSSRTRQVLENIERGVDFFGLEAMAPVFHEQMVPPWEHLPSGTRWVVDEPERLVDLYDRMAEERAAEYARAAADHRIVGAPESFFAEREALVEHFERAPIALSQLDTYDPGRESARAVLRLQLDRNVKLRAELEAARGRKGGELLRPVVDHVRGLTASDTPWRVILVAPNLTHAERLTSLLRGYGLQPRTPAAAEDVVLDLEAPSQQRGGHGPTTVQVVAGALSDGFASPDDGLLLLSESEIFGRITRRAKTRRRAVGVGSLSQLSVGDFVVHVVHGVGRYAGLTKLNLKGIPGDFVLLEYAGTDRLYLPVYRLGEVERYVSAEAKAPKLDKMGGTTFASKTAKVKAEVRQMAEELLQIYAQRAAQDGHAFPPPDEMYAEFEATFPFEETPDQDTAIAAVGEDLSRPQPMDRLICGDVGFGKTEVALRAAFRAAVSGKQVAVLAPTTVLVQQHYNTFRERMARFGVEVGVLNRFVEGKLRKKTLQGIRDGSVDVVVGTHRLLSRDVRFKELGLLVIDEEQRFGVAQKERFKKLKTKVDVLTMTATPIPRTLHMSLLGIREISLVMTPPSDRLAVRTFLTRQGDSVIEDGIRKEMARGGQVFYVVPKIQGIDQHAVRIRQLVPDARVLVAHGRMPAEMLEKTMFDFIEHRADVLVSTTIIESGLDIPRANTMFIARADSFGLSQLYQLRGRIGRSRHRAYCYLMVNKLDGLSDEARKRLEAIQRYSELGSGFHVASQDLEIRGAGEILGARQSGQIQAIGFEAYSRILSEAVAELKGESIVHETDPELVFDVPAFLPDTYVEDTGTRLDLYRRLSAATTIDEVRALMEEIRDRFGEPPTEAEHLGYLMGCKTYGRALRAHALELRGDRFSVRLGPDTPLSSQVAAGLAHATDGRFRLLGADRVATTVIRRDGPTQTVALRGCQDALAELVTYARVGGP